jgi:hypothetical protein
MVQYGREQRRIARKETEEQETEEEDYRLTVHQDRLCYIIRVVSRDNMPHTQSLRSTVQSLTPEHATERLTTKNKNNDKPRRFVSLPKMAKRTPNAQQQEQRSVKTICSISKDGETYSSTFSPLSLRSHPLYTHISLDMIVWSTEARTP